MTDANGPGVVVAAPRTVAISGASSGIGAALARAFARAGWNVCAGARRTDRIASVADPSGDAAGSVWSHALDVTDLASVESFFAAAEAEVGPVDAVVANAGTAVPGRLAGADLAEVRRVFDTNLHGALNVAQRTIRGLLTLRAEGDRRLGDVVFVSSDAVEKPYVNLLSYGASKAALEYFAAGLRHELAETGIRVTVLRLGPTATGFGSDWEPAEVGPLMRAWKLHGVIPHVAVLDPDDVATAVVDALSRAPEIETRLLALGPLILPPDTGEDE